MRHGLPQQAGGVLRAAHGGRRLRPRDGPSGGARCAGRTSGLRAADRSQYSRTETLVEPVVAVPLYELFHMGTGEPHVRTRSELAERFRISTDAKVVVTGVHRDAEV